MKALFSAFLIFGAFFIQVDTGTSDSTNRLLTILQNAGMRIHDIAAKKPYHLDDWNASVGYLSDALKYWQHNKRPKLIIESLRQARLAHDKNVYAVLLEGLLQETQGDLHTANERYKKFIAEGTRFTGFEKRFINWNEYYELREIMISVLKTRNVAIGAPSSKLRLRISFDAIINYFKHPNPEDRIFNLGIGGSLVLGGLLLVVAVFSGVDFSERFAGSMVSLFMIFLLSYSVWLIDLAAGLPFAWVRQTIVPWMLAILVLGLTLLELRGWWKERNPALEEGYKRCSHCRQPIVELSVECTFCHQKVE